MILAFMSHYFIYFWNSGVKKDEFVLILMDYKYENRIDQ